MIWFHRIWPFALTLGAIFPALIIAQEFLPAPWARFSHAVKILLPVMLVGLIIKLQPRTWYYKTMNFSAGLGALGLVGWGVWSEVTRLLPYKTPALSWNELFKSFDPYVFGGILIALLFMALFFQSVVKGSNRNTKGRQNAQRSDKAVYGDAEFMSMTDAGALFPAGHGMVIGERYRPDLDTTAGPFFDPADKKTHGKGGKSPLLAFNGNFGSTHGLIFAGSGAYKTTGIVVPSALNWSGSMVVLDPSREIGPMVANHRDANYGKEAIFLDPDQKYGGFNVLDWVFDSKSPEENIAAVVSWLISAPAGKGDSASFFVDSARQLLTGVLADMVFNKEFKDEEKNLRTLRRIVADPEPKLKKRLVKIHNETENDFVRQTVGPFTAMTESTFSGVYATVSKDTAWLSYERYANLVSGDSFKTADILKGNIDIYINIDLNALRTHKGLGRVIVGSLLNAMYEADGDFKERVLFMLDEASTLGKMEIIETARDAGRKYGITMTLIYQSLGQLLDAWGQHAKSQWYESTSYRIFAAINDEKTAEELSKMCGEYTITIKNKSKSGGRGGKLGSTTSTKSNSSSTQTQKRRLILPHEILQDMRGDEQLVFVSGRPPLRCGRAIYFRRPEMVETVTENRFGKKKG